MRQRRAKVANAGIAKPTPQKGKRRPAPLAAEDCPLTQALTTELANAANSQPTPILNPFAWEQDKATLGWELLCKGRLMLASDPDTAIKLVKQGSEMVESCLPVLRAEQDEDSGGQDWSEILTPDQMKFLTELLVESHTKGAAAP